MPASRTCEGLETISRSTTGVGTRTAIALRAAFQSVAWVGVEAGIFRRHGIEVTFTLETGGPRAAAGTVQGDWEFCHTGDVPIVEGVAQGQDPVLIVAPTAPHDAAFLMARPAITTPQQLANKRIGGVDAKGSSARPSRRCWMKPASRPVLFPSARFMRSTGRLGPEK